MKTWKQGVVGNIYLKDEKVVYVKFLKYPLALFYSKYDVESKIFEKKLFYAYLNLSILKFINRIDELKMNLPEKKLSLCFSVDFQSGKININSDANSDLVKAYQHKLLEIDDLEFLIMKSNT